MTIDTRTLPDFTSISLEGNSELTLVRGETPSITIEADPEVMEHLKVEVVNGRLILGMKSWLDFIFHSWKPVLYQVTYRSLEAVSISGSSKIRAAELEANRFSFQVSGSSAILVEKLTVDDLRMQISGAGELDLSGTARRQEIRISGSGKMEGWALDSQVAEVHISGSGNLVLKVRDQLDVSISGSGSVRYLGSPKVNHSISGSGSVRQMS
jgi:hypothetical protein